MDEAKLSEIEARAKSAQDATGVRPLRAAPARAGDAWEEGRE